ncbi:MAG: PKD domain-containing protein, partial [Bacteroidota bacterium]
MTYSQKPNQGKILTGMFSMFFIVSTLFVVSCGDDDEPAPLEPPTAAFTSSANQLTVSFTNTSTDADSYSWDFGDGTSSDEVSPTHIYAAAGTYTVTLTATNDDGDDTASESITVEAPEIIEPPVAAFTFSVEDLVVTFSNSSVGGATYNWDFGDGNTSDELSPTHTYGEGGTFTVTLTATNSEGDDTASEDLTVVAPRLTSGFAIIGVTEDGSARFGSHFDQIPTGMIDLSQGTSFQRLFVLSVLDGALFSARTDGESGFSRTIIDAEGNFIEDANIATISDGSFQLKVRNSDLGVLHDRNDANIVQTFNPVTMSLTGNLDMSMANAVVPDEPVRYQKFIFRSDDEFIAPMRTEAGQGVPDMAMPIVSVLQGGVVDVAVFEGLGDVVYLNGTRYNVTENGDTYVWTAGN